MGIHLLLLLRMVNRDRIIFKQLNVIKKACAYNGVPR